MATAPLPRQPELTVRGILLGAAITLVFTAANVYLGLRVGLTFATSIPAAVISMAVLRLVRDAGILENNIVQTVASAAGTLAAIIFVLPGLVIVGWWSGFPFWQSFLVCAIGGTLGVMFSIPLRRALVTGSDLPYPEGVAAAEVLKVGVGSREGAAEGRLGLRLLGFSSLVSAGFALLVAMRLLAGEVAGHFRAGTSATGLTAGFSFALLGAGHLVGLSVGLAMFAGLVFSWAVATPILTAGIPGAAEEVATSVFSTQVRFIGAGAIGVAALFTLATLAGPILKGLAAARVASVARRTASAALPIEEQDIPIGIVGATILLLMVPIAILLHGFLAAGPLGTSPWPLILGALAYTLIAGAFIAAVCGYMAGLIGASNSPVSGVGILAVLGFAVLLGLFAAPFAEPGARAQLVAYALFVTAIIFAAATISNDNLQDLKTGQLVGATPWKQQVALLFGVLAGAAIIPVVLDMLNAANGFPGGPPGIAADPLPAPQATLIAALARGVLGGDLDWSLIGVGALVGVGLIALDTLLKRAGRLRMPPLAVGIGIYLPPTVTLAVTLGAITGYYYERRAARMRDPEAARRMGVLMASGLIVGESLFGVATAGLIVATGQAAPLAVVGDGFAGVARLLVLPAFAAAIMLLYRRAAASAHAV